MADRVSATDPMVRPLATFRDPLRTAFEDAWVGMEPTFQSRKSVRKWREMSERCGGEDAYFQDRYMLDTQRHVAKAIRAKYRQRHAAGKRYCMFEDAKRTTDFDQWHVRRQCLAFHWRDPGLEAFEVRFGLDP